MCWHKWKVIKTEVLPSMLEQIGNREVNGMDTSMNPAYKPALVTYRCTKCGAEKVKRT